MIFPDSSGILFTADSLTGSRNIIKIDAVFGLGETLVKITTEAEERLYIEITPFLTRWFVRKRYTNAL